MHTSIKLDTPVEFINITPLNPLISKCQIKVCYVGDDANRNRSVITKEVAKQMANSLPGSPIVGFFNETKGDFEEHNRIIDLSNGKFEIKDTTRPYGFVDLSAKVWFQKFLDDGMNEREYLMTEGWLWTGQYPECQRILKNGNNQSMELDENHLNARWSESDNGKPSFFIINEAIISKLCILGEDNEPCFEGASVEAPTIQFAFADGFKEQVFSMMNELKELLTKGGEKVFSRYSVEIGDSLWNALYAHVHEQYSIESVCEEEEQKFAVLSADEKYYRLDFSIAEDGSVVFAAEANLLEDYTPDEERQFDPAAVSAYAESLKEEEPEVEETKEEEPQEGEEEKEPECENPESEPESEEEEISEEDDKEKNENSGKTEKYNLEEIQEYVELSQNYSALEEKYNQSQERITELENQLSELVAFKKSIEKAEKEKMIDSFCMLSDEDKADVIANIDTYSLDDIEAKLSILCVRNKVSFNLDNSGNDPQVTTVLPHDVDDGVPAWVKLVRSVANEM